MIRARESSENSRIFISDFPAANATKPIGPDSVGCISKRGAKENRRKSRRGAGIRIRIPSGARRNSDAEGAEANRTLRGRLTLPPYHSANPDQAGAYMR